MLQAENISSKRILVLKVHLTRAEQKNALLLVQPRATATLKARVPVYFLPVADGAGLRERPQRCATGHREELIRSFKN